MRSKGSTSGQGRCCVAGAVLGSSFWELQCVCLCHHVPLCANVCECRYVFVREGGVRFLGAASPGADKDSIRVTLSPNSGTTLQAGSHCWLACCSPTMRKRCTMGSFPAQTLAQLMLIDRELPREASHCSPVQASLAAAEPALPWPLKVQCGLPRQGPGRGYWEPTFQYCVLPYTFSKLLA